jgi:hypothetical protein
MKPELTKRRPSGLVVGCLVLLLWLAVGLPVLGAIVTAQAAPAGQIFIYTPTPGPDGRIIYIVKENDTLLAIALLTGVSVEKLKELNNLADDTIYPGQKLLLGLAGPAEITVTAGPPPTATPIRPTDTPKPGKGELCILLYNDVNGDAIRQADEASIPDGAVSFGNRAVTISQSFNTAAGLEAQCFMDLPEGEYTISVAIPAGYNATTETSNEIALRGGDRTFLNFGAQANSQTVADAPVIPASGEKRSPLLGIVGGLFLLAGVGVAILAGRLLRG